MKFKIHLLLFVFFAGCLQTNASVIEPGDPGKMLNEISGIVVDASSKKPLKEVSVTAFLVTKKEKHVVSDESGKFAFDELSSGIYKLVFEKEGYKKVTRNKITVKADENFQLRIEMIESGDFDLVPSPKYFFNTD